MTAAERDEHPAGELPPADAPDADPASALATALARVTALEAELETARAQRARAVADYQNLQRRSAEAREEQARLTMKALVLTFLPVLDDLSRAVSSVREHGELAGHPWVEGVRLVQQKFRAVLEAGGVREIAAEGQPFDPQQHQAVARAAGPEGIVVGLVQSGYMLDGIVVRPAMVLVGNGDPAPGDVTGASPGAER